MFWNHFYRPIVAVLAFFKHYKRKGYLKMKKGESYIVLSNHQTGLDGILLPYSFQRHLYGVLTDSFLSKGWVAKMFQHQLGLIGKHKGAVDIKANMDMMRCIREGGSLLIFPEGNRNYGEFQFTFTDGFAKFVRFFKKPIVLFNFHGGTGVDPRFAKSRRKGPFYGEIKRILRPEEFENWSDDELYKDDYELLAGTWPVNDTDCVLVISGSDGISDFVLYAMGIKDAAALNEQISSVVSGKGNNAEVQRNQVFSPQDFLGISFKLLPAYEKYEYNSGLGIWIDISSDSSRMMEKLSSAEDLSIVGVVKAKEGSSYGILGVGIEYTAKLTERLMEQAGESEIVKAQLASPDVDMLTGRTFGEDASASELSLLDLISIQPEKALDAITIRWDLLESLVPEDVAAVSDTLSRIMSEFYWKGSSKTLAKTLENGSALLGSIVEVDKQQLSQAFSLTLNQARLQELLASMTGNSSSTLEVNLNRFGYADPDSPSLVSIYPRDFESKEEVLNILERYNAAMEADGLDDKVIYYTDYVGALMGSVTTIINAITYVLVAFVSISLVVSSIMIGIITYISVLERRKEIGILRALGASKRNISQVFNAETFIIGLLSGIFGILLTLLLQIPINAIITTLAEQDGIKAFLPAGSGLVLVLLCVLLTFIGGLIPSRKAARQDPVLALRSE